MDGFEYIDFALGDTGAMAGHSPDAPTAAVRRRIETLGGITTMLPTEDSGYVAAELTRRFGMPLLAPVASTALQLLLRSAARRPLPQPTRPWTPTSTWRCATGAF